MTDKELLELAAKAAGMETMPPSEGVFLPSGYFFTYAVWNPLTDDGDALRLAVKLELDVNPLDSSMWVSREFVKPKVDVEEPYGDDPYAATRRAIVRAAAEIGKTIGETK